MRKQKKKEDMMSKIIAILFVMLIIVVALVAIAGVYFFGLLGIFKFMGVTYITTSAFLWFVLLLLIVGSIVDFLSRALISLFKPFATSALSRFILIATIDIWFSWFAIYTADTFVKEITLSFGAEFALAVILFIIDYGLDMKVGSVKVKVENNT
ncbi:YrvL family regulatory protein [Priestia flexa]|uniref:YrvL family regulatory protein n=1 Tax=Priestia flexa TaxID=86664 RepID=UPI001B325ADC|nr:YrvL family regulatory protein [Priestia flexa]